MSDHKRGTTQFRNGAAISAYRRFLDREIDIRGTSVRHLAQLLIFSLVVLVVTIGAVLINWSPGTTSLQPGEIAGQTFEAQSDATFTSDIRTEELRRQAFDSVENIVKTYDDSIRPTQIKAANSFFDDASEIREKDLSDADKIAELKASLEGLDSTSADLILRLSDSAWTDVEAEVIRLVDQTLAQPLQSDELDVVLADLPNRVATRLTTSQRDLSVAIASQFVSPNVFIDDAATQAKRQAASDAIVPVEVSVKVGQAIVRDGDLVDEEDVEALQKLGLLQNVENSDVRIGEAGLMAILTAALVVYLYLFNKNVWHSRQLILVALVVLVPIVVGSIVLPQGDLEFLFPVAASAMLLAILISIQFAVVVSAILALYLGVVTDLSFELTLIYFLGAIAGALVIWRAERTMTFIWSGVGVALAMFAVAACFQIIDSQLDVSGGARLFVETGVAGALAASITFLTFSVLGSIFGITTHLQLQELAHPNQELIMRLAQEAPGTYHHSLMVGNLAAAATAKIGGDPLFARVSTLYHDIGKMKHPTFFVENQANLDNIHDTLDPSVSSKIVIDHVSDGVEMARKARLPQSIIDVIKQHHGTTRTEYFYRKALANGDQLDPDDFRYPGPKPQSKVAAIIMLADSVESAVRSMAQSNRLFARQDGQSREEESNRLADVVHGVIQAKIDDDQLIECDITLKDIQTVEGSFIQILEGIYHPRIEYPELSESVLEPVVSARDSSRESDPEPSPTASD